MQGGVLKIAYFLERGITSVANPFLNGATFGGLCGTHPPKTYPSTPPRGGGGVGVGLYDMGRYGDMIVVIAKTIKVRMAILQT